MLSKKDKQGIALLTAAAAGFLAIIGAFLAFGGKPKVGEDLCSAAVGRNSVFLLDYSEEISDQTLDEIRARALSHIDTKVQVGERVSIFTVSDLSKSSLKPVISLCKPADVGNRLVENTRGITKQYQQKFLQPITEVLSKRPLRSKESPIAQAITDISLSKYLRGPSNSLLVFSDMLENTSKFSLYKCEAPDSAISRYRSSRAGALERPTFKNTSVELSLIPRLGQSSLELKCRDRLWAWFFGDSSGSQAALGISYLPGGEVSAQQRVRSSQ